MTIVLRDLSLKRNVKNGKQISMISRKKKRDSG